MNNPTFFLMEYPEVPFNFDFNFDDFDAFWHNPNMPDVLKGGDPCLWSPARKEEVNRQRDEWLTLYKEWVSGKYI